VTGVSVADELPGPDGRGPLSGDNAGTGRLGDKAFAAAAKGSGALVIGLVTLVGVFLLWQAIPAIADDKVNFLTSRQWAVSDSDNLRFGIVELLWTTVAASTIAMLIAVPVGVAVALFITQYSPRWLSRPAASVIDLLAAVPSIVYGLWGLKTFPPWFDPFQIWLSDHLGWIPLFSRTRTSGTILLIGVVLAIMILPIVTALSREVFAQTPVTHKEGALALGATKWEMIRTAVIPFGRAGIISAAMLGLGRALGETIAVALVLNSGFRINWHITEPGGDTFASTIALKFGEAGGSPVAIAALIAAGLFLFVITLVVNTAARIVIARRKEFT